MQLDQQHERTPMPLLGRSMVGCRIAIVVLTLVGCGFAYVVGTSLGRKPSPPPPIGERIGSLVVASDELDLGEVWEQKTHTHPLRIQNISDADIEIDRFEVGCRSCTRVEPESVRIRAGGSTTVKLILDLTPRSVRDYGSPSRAMSYVLLPILRSNSRPARPDEKLWTLRGVVKNRVTVDSLSLDFGESPTQGEEPPTIRVRATLHDGSTMLAARIDDSICSARLAPVDSQPNQFDVYVTPRPNLSPGRFDTELTLSVAGNEGERPGVAIPVTGSMRPEIRLLPARVFLGSRPLGSVANETVVLQAPAGRSPAVSRIDADSADLVIKPISIAGVAEGRAFQVVQTIAGPGDHRSIAKFYFNEPNRPARIVEIEVAYRGESRPAVPKTQNSGLTR